VIEERPFDILEERWLVETPSYQIQFWSQLDDPERATMPLWKCETHRIVGAEDVNDALDWAKAHAIGRRIALYAEVDRGPDQGVILIFGKDPTLAH
jgi:hypothetical protein